MELLLFVLLMLGWPLLVAVPLVAFTQTPRRAHLTVDLHGMRWMLRTGHLTGWLMAPALVLLVAAFAWPEWLVRSLLQDDFMCGQVGPPCEAVWPVSTLTAAAVLACVLAWPWLRTRWRRHPAEVRADTAGVQVGSDRIPWADIDGAHVERRGWPIRYKTLVLRADPPVRIAVDREGDDAVEQAVGYLQAACEAAPAPPPAPKVPVPAALRELARRYSMS